MHNDSAVSCSLKVRQMKTANAILLDLPAKLYTVFGWPNHFFPIRHVTVNHSVFDPNPTNPSRQRKLMAQKWRWLNTLCRGKFNNRSIMCNTNFNCLSEYCFVSALTVYLPTVLSAHWLAVCLLFCQHTDWLSAYCFVSTLTGCLPTVLSAHWLANVDDVLRYVNISKIFEKSNLSFFTTNCHSYCSLIVWLCTVLFPCFNCFPGS